MNARADFPTVTRPTAHRLTALLAALFFLSGWTGDALALRPCPHHDVVPGMGVMAHAGHPAMAGHGRHAPAPEHGRGHACTCMGSCPSAGGGALPSIADAALRVAPAEVRDASPAEDRGVEPRLIPHLLPYSQAPPRLG